MKEQDRLMLESYLQTFNPTKMQIVSTVDDNALNREILEQVYPLFLSYPHTEMTIKLKDKEYTLLPCPMEMFAIALKLNSAHWAFVSKKAITFLDSSLVTGISDRDRVIIRKSLEGVVEITPAKTHPSSK